MTLETLRCTKSLTKTQYGYNVATRYMCSSCYAIFNVCKFVSAFDFCFHPL